MKKAKVYKVIFKQGFVDKDRIVIAFSVEEATAIFSEDYQRCYDKYADTRGLKRKTLVAVIHSIEVMDYNPLISSELK